MTGRKKRNNKWLVLGCMIAVLCILIAGVVVMLCGEDQIPGGSGTTVAAAGMTQGQTQTQSGSEAESVPGDTAAGTQTGTEPASEKQTNPRETVPQQSAGHEQETSRPVVQEPVTVPQQKEATYEQWLAAGMIIGVSMEYPDFELQGIYLTGETALADKMESDGVYILFTSGGKAMAIHSSPLQQERTISGTVDMSTQAIGFATFDAVDPASVNTGAMTAAQIESLDELIAQSLLVSLYWN